ncbi:uncharacterized protein N7477_002277 [Penicillium maclennaniae]|uniref:uncharacterized protein n=1 Tax=Penicillium maclennaniae TaxID=1343394 RepID=UPI0025417823|nr:uncharacterized protein N7477_002277 [Penicillium maclennaniae]KAJ5676644.1 hypothetical protein N7477_002277 [Penicillium maclennaniae]
MSPPSPKKKNGGNGSGPRQIRFVATDGQPQTKRRRVNAACLTCRRRKIRCSGEQPVCKTCSDYKHVCLGYSESTAHLRSQSDSTSRPPDPPFGQRDPNSQHLRAVESSSPEAPPRSAPGSNPNRSPQILKHFENKDASLLRDNSARTNKETDSQLVVDTPESSRTSLSSGNRTHVPYFRYFGPTAIVPGFKQMVGLPVSSLALPDSLSPLRSPKPSDGPFGLSAAATEHRDSRDSRDSRESNSIPFYDRDDTLPVPNLVSHLSDLFFTHLGCSFPFLQRERFMQDLKGKKVDTMLVDAVCALAARFSPHPLLGPAQAPPIDHSQLPPDPKFWDRGLPFAQRATSALVDSLSCPTLSGVQACLLLAYEQFGSNRDSGLWMYLGISIRMAQDLGLQKYQGLKHNYGQKGVTPSSVMTGQAGKWRDDQYDDFDVYQSPKTVPPALDTERAIERERVDSFWSIFFLDRVISSGTGRPVTLRDEDIELCFPLQSESQLPNGWPAPFPPLIRIIHLYGRVTDLINGIQDVHHVTPDTLKRLASMESDLTGIYQRLSPKLHFNAANFQAYVKAKEGTNFILLHFWFHTLIVLLHQPTLLHSFGGSIQHLYPNSRELSMSSAKTIADILSFSELVDGKSFIGNPFTSQPMYIAACAFLMESAYYSSPSSRGASPPSQSLLSGQSSGFVMPNMESSHSSERKSNARHILLASAAKENYQRCYKALKALDAYWEGTRYILTVLDQKAKGIVDPLLYTEEDMENTTGLDPVQQFAPGGWPGSKSSNSTQSFERPPGVADIPSDGKWSPKIDPSQAIGWALTGATNSSQPNLSLLYQMPTATQTNPTPDRPTYSSQYSHSYPPLHAQNNAAPGSNPSFAQTVTHDDSMSSSLAPKFPSMPPRTISANSPYFLPMGSAFPESSSRVSERAHPYDQTLPSAYHYDVSSTEPHTGGGVVSQGEIHPGMHTDNNGMMIESHDVDMNSLHQPDSFPFSNGEILPWLEYLPQDVLSLFGEPQNYPLMSPEDTTPRPQ